MKDANRGRARHREDDLTGVLERPRRQHLRIAGIWRARRAPWRRSCRTGRAESAIDVRRLRAGVGQLSRRRRRCFCRIASTQCGMLAMCPASWPRLNDFSCGFHANSASGVRSRSAPRRSHLVVEFRQQCIFQSHGQRICRPSAPVQPSEWWLNRDPLNPFPTLTFDHAVLLLELE